MWWSLCKDWRVFPHLMAVLVGWLTNLAFPRVRCLPGRGLIAIGLVEHLGDIVAAEPVSRFARMRHPGAKIVWFARRRYASVPADFAAVAITKDGILQRSLCGKISIQQTAEVIRRAALFIGIDSGPAHIANAFGTSGVILLGRYRGFADYMPFSGRYQNGEGAEIVRTNGALDTLSVAAVLAAVRRQVSCNQSTRGSAAT